jgi:type I restriction enzyme R subunit
MSYQSEYQLEQELVKQLTGLGYESVKISSEEQVLRNLKAQLEAFNNHVYTDFEFEQILNHLGKGNVFQKAATLRDRFAIKRDDETLYVQFFDSEQWLRNRFQVTTQIEVDGVHKVRFDVTLLINGLPLVQIELKRRGLEMKEAFNQVNRYQRHAYWTNRGLFQYVQLFVISNGVNTKYYANNRKQSYKQTFDWADEQNQPITKLSAFTDAFLNCDHLGKMIAHYMVRNETHKILMVLRPYQYYAVEAMIKRVKQFGKLSPQESQHQSMPEPVEGTTNKNGYIWHTTGSGKTLTSFKASQVIMNLPDIEKVVFVVDRQDLDYQTANEFNAFKKDSVDMTENTRSLVDQFNDEPKLIVTTIQKLSIAIKKQRYRAQMEAHRQKKMVFIFDECHRSQFGKTHQAITQFFSDVQLFGFTGTPIFADNASKNDFGKRTTADLFDECLHKYVITDAIRDENVLKFAVEYIGRFKKKSNTMLDIDVEAIDTKEAMEDPRRLEKIVDYIIAHHAQKTYNKDYSAIFATSGIDALITYYELFKKKKEEGKHDLRIATIFTYRTNEDDADATGELPALENDEFGIAAEPAQLYNASHSRDKLEEYIGDYNAMFGTSYTTKDSQSFQDYYKNISKRLKDREKENFDHEKHRLDIVLVVSMMLTGFDAKKVNTLYVDKNLRYHGLIQAYSRTNRILGETKSQGNILCFRNLKERTDEAIALFSNLQAKEEIFTPTYEEFVKQFNESFIALMQIAPSVKSVDQLPDEETELEFVKAFRALMRTLNVLKTMVEFDWDDLSMPEQNFEDYKSKYLDLHDKVRTENQVEKVSILDDVDFELELIHKDEINRSYIIKLLARLQQADEPDKEAQTKAIMDMLSGDVELRSKRELIEKFIEENLPKIEDLDTIEDEFEQFWHDQKVLRLKEISEEENLDEKQFRNLMDRYVFSDKEPLQEEVMACMESRPSLLKAHEIGSRIIQKMRDFVDVFVRGMVG